MTIEVKGWIAILIAYRGDSVFISRVVIMRAGRFSVDATVYHRFMHAPGSLRSFPGFKMTLVAFFIEYSERGGETRRAIHFRHAVNSFPLQNFRICQSRRDTTTLLTKMFRFVKTSIR